MRQTGKRMGALILALVLAITAYPATVQAKTHTLGNSFTNQMLGSHTCEYGGKIYYGLGDRIYSIKKDGTGKKTVFLMKDAKQCNGFTQIAVYDGYIYALFDYYKGDDDQHLQLVCVKLNGSDYRNFGNAASFSVVDGRIYYTKEVVKRTDKGQTNIEGQGIYVMDLDGTNEKVLVSNKQSRLWATDGTHMYYHVDNLKTLETQLYRCDMNGKNRTRLLAKSAVAMVDGDNTYYLRVRTGANGGGGLVSSIYCKNQKSGAIRKIYSCKDLIVNFYLSGKNLYVSRNEKGIVQVNIQTGKAKLFNRHVGAGIKGVHGSVVIFEQYREDEKAGVIVDIVLAKVATGRKIKKLGNYFIL